MLHYYGEETAMDLAERARSLIFIYAKNGTALVPFKDLAMGRVRYVYFEFMAGQWVFLDLVD